MAIVVITLFMVVVDKIHYMVAQEAIPLFIKEIADSLVSAADKIMDFKTGIDKIDLSTLIQDTFSSKILNFVDNFTGNAGEATLSYNEVTNASELAINAYGYNYNPDFKIDIVGFVNYETDFIV